MNNTLICPNCGVPSGYAVKAKKGNVLIGIILLLFFLIPGVIYFIWMGSGGTDVCIRCKQPGLVPLSSPRGKQLATQYSVEAAPEVKSCCAMHQHYFEGCVNASS
jgi:hypothetical protein